MKATEAVSSSLDCRASAFWSSEEEGIHESVLASVEGLDSRLSSSSSFMDFTVPPTLKRIMETGTEIPGGGGGGRYT